ncbi:MAG: hypothetical protein ABJH72_06820 [Reichenbachiella sp.]|uniref:hypothetical protein n=1 Tax=Reichenbachiella sp. TaxID=2184521 RepID=UPI003267F799
MIKFITIIFLLFLSATTGACEDSPEIGSDDQNFKVKNVQVTNLKRFGINVWEIEVEGQAGATIPTGVGQLDGAPVMGYVFPTSLKSTDVGFSVAEGILALALTSHPDFDDTPLWDENNDTSYDNDGVIWHAHWVLLVEDERVAGGLAVRQFDTNDAQVNLPPTNPGMPMFMDSPGFQVITEGSFIRVVVPMYRMNNQTDFNYDAVAVYMQVNTSNSDLPMLGVYEVYSVASGDLSLPYSVEIEP